MDGAKFENVAVVGLARVDAPEVMTSAAIEEALAPAMARAGFSKGLLYQLTGIRQRRLWPAQIGPSDAAAQAGAKALEDAGVAPGQVGVVISTSVSKDYVEPSVASLAHHKLGLASDCLNFDVSNACLGFLNGLQIVGDMIERGHLDYGLVVCGESSREVLEATIERLNDEGTTAEEIRPQLATLTLGSGGAAMVLGRRDQHGNAPRLVGSVTRAATNHNGLCRGQRTWMETDAAMLLVHGLGLAEKTFAAARDILGWTPEAIDYVAAHQVSAVHTARGAERLNLEIEKFAKIFGDYGNVGPASIPIALSRLRETGQLERGNRIALMGIGSGLNVSMMEIQW